MKGIEERIASMRVSELVALLKERKLPLVHENASIKEIINSIVSFRHSRLLYVVDDDGKLTGAISLGLLVRHVFSPSHEPHIHPRFLMNMITAESAKDFMQKNPVVATEEEKVETVLKRMIKTNVKELPVVDKKKRVVADLTIIDLLSTFL